MLDEILSCKLYLGHGHSCPRWTATEQLMIYPDSGKYKNVGWTPRASVELTSTLVGGEWSASCSSLFTLGERAPATHWIGGWVGARTGLDDMEKRKFLPLPGLELRFLGRPARSHSLYRLRSPGSPQSYSSKASRLVPYREIILRSLVGTVDNPNS
jgi:hypothetical protein